MHSHSGIATLTWQPGCDVAYQDTTGKNGVLNAGGLEWMMAGGGAWHQGRLMGQGFVTGFQLWVPMPSGTENGRPLRLYVAPADVPVLRLPGGEIKVFLGSLSNGAHQAVSPIQSFQDMNYLAPSPESGARWTYNPPSTHEIGFAFVFEGEARDSRAHDAAGSAGARCARRFSF